MSISNSSAVTPKPSAKFDAPGPDRPLRATLKTQPPLPYSVKLHSNLDQAQLRELALKHTPCCFKTSHGSICKTARNKARMAKFTYVIDRDNSPERYSHATIEPAKAQQLIEAQANYIAEKGELLIIDGYVGLGPAAVPMQWCYTLEGANIAGMQQILSFPRSAVETSEQQSQPFAPAMRLVYTPDFCPDMPGGQAIVVDLVNYCTYVMGADYFGESKKGALRMTASLVYEHGGLLMHSGAKEIQCKDQSLSMGILGLSGTGKTTTTFSKQGELAKPIQDDMVAIWPGGVLSVTENGCFAKTFGLTEQSEPVIYKGTCDSTAWLENVYLDETGTPDFFKGILSAKDVERLRDQLIATGAPKANVDAYIRGEKSENDVIIDGIPEDGWDFVRWTENGRSIVPMSAVEGAADLHNIPALRSLGILNRDEGADAAVPGLVRFTSPDQAAGYMMLGETSKTSAAGKERGRTRSPFTQPFFPLSHRLQATRFSELAATFQDTPMWLMNTGYVAGDAQSVSEGKGLKIKIRHSSAMLEALIANEIVWCRDPDFGYEVVDVDAPENKALLEKVPAEILQPRRIFAKESASKKAYEGWASNLHKERKAFLEKFGVACEIIAAVTKP